MGLLSDSVSGFTSFIWAPTGISIALLFLSGLRFAPALFLGAVLINLSIGASLFVAFSVGLGNMLEAIIAVMFLRKFSFNPSLSRIQDVIILVIPSILFSTFVASIIGVAALSFGGIISPENYVNTWVAWWVRDTMGALVFAPAVLVWFRPIKEIINTILTWAKKMEVLSAFLLLILINFVVFFSVSGDFWTNHSFAYLIFIPLIWIALRMGQKGSVTAIFITSIIAIYSTATGRGPFIEETLGQGLITLYIFMGTVSLTMMTLAATVSEKITALETLKIEGKKLTQEKARTDAVFLSIGDGLVVTDREGRITMINKAFEHLLGWTKEEALGKVFVDIVPKEDEKGVRIMNEDRTTHKTLSGNKTEVSGPHQIHYLVRKDGTRFPVSMTSNAVHDGNMEGVVQVFWDITKEKEIDTAKTEFVSLASHQLRTPATNMKWFLEMLLSGEVGALNKKQKEYFDEVYKNNQRMIGLINTILNVSRIELGIFEVTPIPTDMKSLISGILDEHQSLIKEKSLMVRESYASDLSTILIDPKLVRIVIHNLISNAVKYTPPKGRIDLDVYIKKREENVSGRKMKKDSIIVAVHDTGYGIPANQVKKIFTRLFRADNVRQKDTDGTGLGLYLARMIAEHTKGDLWCESTIRKGSTFYLAMPTEGMKKKSGLKEIAVGSIKQRRNRHY